MQLVSGEPLGSSFVARHELYQLSWGDQDLSTKRWALSVRSQQTCLLASHLLCNTAQKAHARCFFVSVVQPEQSAAVASANAKCSSGTAPFKVHSVKQTRPLAHVVHGGAGLPVHSMVAP